MLHNPTSNLAMEALYTEVSELQGQLGTMQQLLAATLNELHETRCQLQRTQDTVSKVAGFLMSVVKGEGEHPFDGGQGRQKRRKLTCLKMDVAELTRQETPVSPELKASGAAEGGGDDKRARSRPKQIPPLRTSQ